MMNKSNMRLQKEMQIVVDPISLKIPSFRQTHFETTTSPQGKISISDNTLLHPPPPLQPSNHKFSSSTLPSSVISSPQRKELPSKVSNLTHKNHYLQRSMSLLCSKGKITHASSDEFDLRMSEHDNRNQERLSKNEAIIKEGPKGSSKRLEDDDGFKCSGLGMCLPGFGRAKPVKARKGGTVMDHPVIDPVNMMSSTFSLSFENFGVNSGVTQGRMVRENNDDDSISSYFDLPSMML